MLLALRRRCKLAHIQQSLCQLFIPEDNAICFQTAAQFKKKTEFARLQYSQITGFCAFHRSMAEFWCACIDTTIPRPPFPARILTAEICFRRRGESCLLLCAIRRKTAASWNGRMRTRSSSFPLRAPRPRVIYRQFVLPYGCIECPAALSSRLSLRGPGCNNIRCSDFC